MTAPWDRMERYQVEAILLKSTKPDHGGKTMPTKKYFLLEDDTHSAEGVSYLGRESDDIISLIEPMFHVSDWDYEVWKTEDLKLCAHGTIFHEATF